MAFSYGGDYLTFPDGTKQASAAVGMKNRIINGAMVIAQRGTSATVNDAAAFYTTDRWECQGASGDGVYTIAQSSTAPVGFSNSLLATVTTADASLGATQSYSIRQKIEGYNIADLGFGTANAKTVTVSFWVRSSLTGTFGGALINGGFTRSYPYTYTISAANTWEYKTITIAGDTTGTWTTDNTLGMTVTFALGQGSSRLGTAGAWVGANNQGATGQTNVIATNGATFYITGVQLEVGSSATSFDYRPYGTELNLCQRYFQSYAYTLESTVVSIGTADSTSSVQAPFNFFQEMRTAPTVTLPAAGKTAGTMAFLTSGGTYPSTVGTHNANYISKVNFKIGASGYTSAFTQGNAVWLYPTGTTCVITASAEL